MVVGTLRRLVSALGSILDPWLVDGLPLCPHGLSPGPLLPLLSMPFPVSTGFQLAFPPEVLPLPT